MSLSAQYIITFIILALAVGFVVRYIYRIFRANEDEDPACASCPLRDAGCAKQSRSACGCGSGNKKDSKKCRQSIGQSK